MMQSPREEFQSSALREVNTPLELRQAEERLKLEGAVRQGTAHPSKSEAERLVEAANELHALETDPQQYISAKDALSLLKEIKSFELHTENEAVKKLTPELISLIAREALQTRGGKEFTIQQLEETRGQLATDEGLIRALTGEPEALELLSSMAVREDHPNRCAAIKAMLGLERASFVLEKILRSSPYHFKSYSHAAAQTLASTATGIHALKTILRDESLQATARWLSAEALGTLPMEEGEELLRLAMESDSSKKVRFEAAKALHQSYDMSEAFFEIARSMGDRSEQTENAAIRLVGHGEEQRRFLTALLEHQDEGVAFAAIDALAKDPKGANILIDFLKSKESPNNSKGWALKALAGQENAAPVIESYLFDTDARLRAEAVQALKGCPSASQTLRGLLLNGGSYISTLAAYSLQGDDNQTEFLLELLEDAEGLLRINAAVALHENEVAAPKLIEVIQQERKGELQVAAVNSLAKKVRPELLEVLSSESYLSSVRSKLIQKLAGISEAEEAIATCLYSTSRELVDDAITALPEEYFRAHGEALQVVARTALNRNERATAKLEGLKSVGTELRKAFWQRAFET